MTQLAEEIDATPAADRGLELPVPSEPKVIFLGGLFILAFLAAASVAAEILLPLVFAMILKLLLQPAMRLLQRLHVPRALSALVLILLLFGTIVGLVAALSGPAASWAGKLPEGIPRIQEKLSFLAAPINALQLFLRQVENIESAGGQHSILTTSNGSSFLSMLFAGTRSLASGLATTILLLYFLLAAGDTFLRRFVEILPNFRSKRQAVDISQQIETDISAYLATITLMNLCVGVATGLVMWLTGVGDPVLWGTVTFFLNYAPIVGPVFGCVIFLLAGFLTIDSLWLALLPAGLYFCIHLAEGEILTPTLLARKFTLNPVLVVISFIFWFWMWGILGAILSMPMLAIFKIVCDRVRVLGALGHFLAG
eukprot:gene7702-7763_t